MRQITIDFDKLTCSGLAENKYAGYLGEHNATELVIVKPVGLVGINYSVAFQTNGEVYHSKFFSADEDIVVALWQQLTQDSTLYVQLEAYDESGDYLGKSNVARLFLGNSVHGIDVIADADNPDVYSEIALNTWFRETLEDNADTLNKLTSENDELYFNGLPVGNGSGSGGGISSDLANQIQENTENRHWHNNKSILDRFGGQASEIRPTYNLYSLALTNDIPSNIAVEHVRSLMRGADVNNILGFASNGYLSGKGLVEMITELEDLYAQKTDIYTQAEIDEKISLIPKFSIEPVDTLPETDISETTVYLVRDNETDGNLYTEYIYVNGVWELLGLQSFDLTGYYTKEEIDNKGFIVKGENAFVEYVSTITLPIEETAITDDIVTLGTGWSGNVTDGFTHASGNAEPLTLAINANNGEKFIVEYNTSVTGDYILLKLGNAESIENVYPTSPYNGTTTIQWGLVCSGDNGILQVIPTSNFNGAISNFKVYKITESGEKEIVVNLDNVGIGNLPNHIAGFYNFYLSPTSMQKSVNGTRNVAIGYASLRDIVSGGRNIGLGTFTLASLMYGENNIGIGADACLNLPLAENVVAIGKGAAAFGAKRTDDIAIGRYSLSGSKGTENTSKNVAVGVEAGRDCQSSGNVFIGSSAGATLTTSSNNVIIGNSAGGNKKLTTGWGNTLVGASANADGNFSQTTVVGQGAKATKHKQAVLGGDSTVETVLKGDLIVRGTDGKYRQIVFNEDGSCSWSEVT